MAGGMGDYPRGSAAEDDRRMSPLESARRLAAEEPVCPHPNSAMWLCAACDEETDDERPDNVAYRPPKFNHDPDCPWLAMPQIVAALEAAEAVLFAADDEAGLRLSDVFPRDFIRALTDLEIALGDEGKG